MRRLSGMRRLRVAALSLGLLVVLLALNAFLYSPWHQHSRLSGQACCFSSFEHAPGLQASAYDPLPPPALLAHQEVRPPAVRLVAASRTAHPGRAPPA
jgi:hypothetical protein